MMPPTTEPTSTKTILAPLPSSRLFYRDGGSDKVYHANINAVEGGFTVTFAFGRRGNARKAVAVGNVTIPPNKALPTAGALVEIRYLYAYKGGSLYQATYLGERDDLEVGDCVLGQLKYKAEGGEVEGSEE